MVFCRPIEKNFLIVIPHIYNFDHELRKCIIIWDHLVVEGDTLPIQWKKINSTLEKFINIPHIYVVLFLSH